LVNLNVGLEKKHQNLPKTPQQKAQQQRKPHDSTNINQVSQRLIVVSYILFSLFIVVHLFAATIAGYTFK